MTEFGPIAALREFLRSCSAGSVSDVHKLVALLRPAWPDFHGSSETGMNLDKVYRLETPTWDPPRLRFQIERHAGTINGSSRAALYAWTLNVDDMTAIVYEDSYRQLTPNDKRLDIKPIAFDLASAIVGGTPHQALRRTDGRVRVMIGLLIPATNQQTTIGRRRRFRLALKELIEPHGWKEVRTNVWTCGALPFVSQS